MIDKIKLLADRIGTAMLLLHVNKASLSKFKVKPQPKITCSKLAIVTLAHGVKYVQS